ncbi:ankyrin repeat domain-containing protein [uncultured Fusobacterium sp.]|uniref:ankyrin repeat domain-containing protein n=1 Tax=uncultured Fusobacterium sp. TaxID=159267 RepID=UPI0025E65380|nr:ankyrin repeat domain-containing protein [uncultured Fusobacterium sp.]
MYKIGYLGNFEKVPQVVEYILNSDVENLEKEYKNGWDINKKITLSEFITETPLEIAIQCIKEEVILWLIEKGVNIKADVDDWGTPISSAARFLSSEMCELFIKHGALENLTKKQYKRIYTDIYYGENFKNIDIFEKYGVTVKKYGNNCLRKAVYDKNQKLAQMFLDYGADINYHEYDQVFTDNSTPIIVAATTDSLKLVKWLVEKGADITIKNKFGERPYSIAVLNKNQEMIDYIKSLEPVDFHNEEARKNIIKKYKLPKDMVEFFNKGDLKIEFPENIDSKYIEFWKLEDTVELIWKRKKYLSLVKDLENYWLHLLWYPKEKTLYIFDGEHEEIFKIGDWSYFINNCEEIVGKFLDGDL